MLLSCEKGLAHAVVLIFSKWIVHDSDLGHSFDGEADQDSHSTEVTLGEVLGSIERIDPDQSLLRLKLIEFFPNFIGIHFSSHSLVEFSSGMHLGFQLLLLDEVS